MRLERNQGKPHYLVVQKATPVSGILSTLNDSGIDEWLRSLAGLFRMRILFGALVKNNLKKLIISVSSLGLVAQIIPVIYLNNFLMALGAEILNNL